MSLRSLLSLSFAILLAACAAAVAPQGEPRRVDVCVYGATSAGVVAAIALSCVPLAARPFIYFQF